MANRAYLYSSDHADDWDLPDEGYFDSRWTIPLAWWFFYAPGDVAWAEVRYNSSHWREVKLSAHKGSALGLFATRRPLLMSLLGGGLSKGEVDLFESQVADQPGSHLLVDPSEVLGGMSLSDKEHGQRFERILAALDRGAAAEVLQVAMPYVGELGTGSGGWECQVFGYTYTWDA